MKTLMIARKDKAPTVSEAEAVRATSLIERLRRVATALSTSLRSPSDPADSGMISKGRVEGFDYETLNAL